MALAVILLFDRYLLVNIAGKVYLPTFNNLQLKLVSVHLGFRACFHFSVSV